jgi:hypothetical protein
MFLSLQVSISLYSLISSFLDQASNLNGRKQSPSHKPDKAKSQLSNYKSKDEFVMGESGGGSFVMINPSDFNLPKTKPGIQRNFQVNGENIDDEGSQMN